MIFKAQQNGHSVPQTPPNGHMNGQHNKVTTAPPPAPPPPPAINGIASVSAKAPPPPPPPPTDLKSAPSTGLSLADQLKKQQLRKTSGPPMTNGPGTILNGSKSNDTPPPPQQKQSSAGGHTDLFSELAKKIELRNTTKNCKADTVSTSSSSGVSASDGSDSGATLINNTVPNKRFGPNGKYSFN